MHRGCVELSMAAAPVLADSAVASVADSAVASVAGSAVASVADSAVTSVADSAKTPSDEGCLIFRNDADEAIIVWLNTFRPPCASQREGCTWARNDAVFWLQGADAVRRPSAATSNQELQPKEEWHIELPKDADGFPVWCCSKCTGTGAWFTKVGSVMPGPQDVLRVEYNWNGDGHQIWYNLSGVDGVNANVSLRYTGCDQETHCNIDVAKCPYALTPAGKGVTCGAAKVESNCESCSGLDGFSACDLAGCGTSKDSTVCACRRWWRDNPCALKWSDYIRSGDCDIYAWAYDELVLEPGGADCSGGNVKPNPVNPLRVCGKTKTGNLVVSVKKLF